ncbi:serine-rich adhesin for platelets-like, partial [Ylistrum balloti]|uniref:serine-rich adhesin for platelets-like n=1 Tax=Ylistrum balloti TaxID=509963 RepID=UPI002905F18E
YNSDEDSDRSQSPKPYRDKIVRLDPPTPTKSSRLIPELSPNIDEIGWSGEQKTIRQINKVGNPEWNIDGNVVSFNGKKLLYNFSKQNRQTSATSLSLLDAKKYSPYSNKHETSSSSSTEKMELKDTAFHQGQKFVFQVKRKPGKPNVSGTSLLNDNSLLSPKRPLSPKGPGVSNSQMKQLGPAGMGQVRQLNVGPVGVSKVRQMSQAGQPQMIAKHGQSGGTVKIGTTPTSTGSPRLPMAVNSVSPTGQRIIKIVAAPGQQPLQPGQVINLAELGLVGGANKAIKISGNVLQVKGQSTGFPLSGKTRIIYQGSTSASKIAAVSSTATSVTPTESQTLLAGSISATGTEQQKQAIITLGPSSGLSPLSPNTSVQVDGKSAQEGIIKRSVESSVLQAAQEKSFVGSNNMQAPLENSKSLSGSLTPESKNIASDSPVKTVLPVKTNVPNTSSVITSGDRSPGSDRSNSSDEDIPELFPMNPPQQPPKKRKVSDGSSTSLSPSKVFIQGVSSSPPSVKSHSPPKSPVASHSPKSQVASHSLNSPMVSHSAKLPLAGLSKMNSPPKLTPQSLLGPPKLTCPPRIRSPPKSSGPPKLTPVIPLDSSNGTHSEWKQNTNSKFPPYTPHQTNGPSESRKSVFDAFDMDDSPMQDTGSEHSAKQETNSGNVTKLICDSDDKTEDSVTMDDMLNDTELSRTSSLAVHNSDSVSHSTENRLQEHELESKVDTGKKSPDKGNLFDNFATFLHTPPTIPSQPTSQPTDHNLFNSQSTSLSTSHSSSSQSSSSLSSLSSPFATSQTSSSHYSGRSIFDSISPVSNASHQNNTHPVNISQSEVIGGQKQSLTQNMMDKVSAFAANLHTGSLASRLGNLSPSKSLPMATSLHQSSPVTQGTVNREHISSPVVQQDPDQAGQEDT